MRVAAAGAAGAEPGHVEVRRSHEVRQKRAGGERAASVYGRRIVDVRYINFQLVQRLQNVVGSRGFRRVLQFFTRAVQHQQRRCA